MIDITDNDITVKAPTLMPYRDFMPCPACGLTGGFLRYWRRWVKGAANAHIVFAFCPGGKAPTENVRDTNPLAMAFGKGNHEIEVEYPCAGLSVPHLHLKCGRCDYQWMTEVKK